MAKMGGDEEINAFMTEIEKLSMAVLIDLNYATDGKNLMAVAVALGTYLHQNPDIMSRMSYPLLVLGSKQEDYIRDLKGASVMDMLKAMTTMHPVQLDSESTKNDETVESER
jgi:hypothetical protein